MRQISFTYANMTTTWKNYLFQTWEYRGSSCWYQAGLSGGGIKLKKKILCISGKIRIFQESMIIVHSLRYGTLCIVHSLQRHSTLVPVSHVRRQGSKPSQLQHHSKVKPAKLRMSREGWTWPGSRVKAFRSVYCHKARLKILTLHSESNKDPRFTVIFSYEQDSSEIKQIKS